MNALEKKNHSFPEKIYRQENKAFFCLFVLFFWNKWLLSSVLASDQHFKALILHMQL